MQVRVTPVNEDGTSGDTVTHDVVSYGFDPEHVEQPNGGSQD